MVAYDTARGRKSVAKYGAGDLALQLRVQKAMASLIHALEVSNLTFLNIDNQESISSFGILEIFALSLVVNADFYLHFLSFGFT